MAKFYRLLVVKALRMYSVALLCFAATMHAQEPVAKMPLRLALELVDGSRIIGVPALESLPLRTSYADMKIPLKKVAAVRMAKDRERATVDLSNGDTLTGVLNLDEIKTTTLFGEVSVSTAHIAGFTTLTGELRDSLMLHYTFDRDLGRKVVDASGRGNDGTAIGPLRYVEGISGKGIEITTPDAYVESRAPGLNMNGWRAVTVSVWFKLKQQTTYGTILNRAVLGGAKGVTMHLYVGGLNNTQGGFGCSRQGVISDAFKIGRPPTLNKWYHMVGVLGPRKAYLYINGELDAEVDRKEPDKPIEDSPSYALTIGKCRAHRERWRDSYPHGIIDEVQIWKRELNKTEIAALFKRGNKR